LIASNRTAAATEEHMRRAAIRALDDPAQLARAARIVRAALARQRLTLADLTTLPTTPGDDGGAAA
jgi:hypothetical protein